jgi:hypothetical protein
MDPTDIKKITGLLNELNITVKTSRRAAQKAKKGQGQENERHMCVICFHMFNSHNLLVNRCKNVHKASSQEICQEYKDAEAEYQANPNDDCARLKKIISLLKVTMLEKYRNKRK